MLNPLSPEAEIIYVDSTDSTMLEARRLVEARGNGIASGTVVQAAYQTNGRGRIKDRRWETKPGDGLLFTVIFKTSELMDRMQGRSFTLLPLICGLAAAESLEKYIEDAAQVLSDELPRIRIKWPNDVLADERKICGILCESSGEYIYAGVGINMNQDGFPHGLRRPATSVRIITGVEADNKALLGIFLQRLAAALEDAEWRRKTQQRLYGAGQPVEMFPAVDGPGTASAEPVSGILTGINNEGAVLIKSADEINSFFSGELRV